MATLVACLSVGKGTWQSVHDLVLSGAFDTVFLVVNQFALEKYPNPKGATMILVNPEDPLEKNIGVIVGALKGKIAELDVGVNLVSGTGIEHMAVLAALLKLGVGVRLVVLGPDGILEV